MTKAETATALATMRLAYPAFYSKIGDKEINATVALWTRIFANDMYEVVMSALEVLIAKHSGYPPDIAALRKQIDDMTFASLGEPTNEELWRMLAKAASNGYYGFREEFEKLPPVLKRYLGVADTLREFAVMDETTMNTVSKGQFMKQIDSIRERIKFEQETPEEVKQLFAKSYKGLPPARAQLSPQEINDRRNRLLDKFDEIE